MTSPSLVPDSPDPGALGASEAELAMHAAPRGVTRASRMWDMAAGLFVVAGIALFFFARHALTSIGSGAYAVPKGTSAVAITDLHVAQSRLALWLVGVGIVLGVLAAARHRLGRPGGVR